MDKIYNVIDLINRYAQTNSFWGVCKDVNTKDHFGATEELNLDGKYLYLYIVDEDSCYIADKYAPDTTIEDVCSQRIGLYKM